MIIIYGNYKITFAIDSTNHDAAFLSNSANMNDGRSGTVCSMSFDNGSQSTSVKVTLTLSLTSPLDTTAAIGGVGVINVQGLPLGTKVVVDGITQRLAPGPRGEPCAWFLPQTTGNSMTVDIYNDVNGTASIAAGAVFGIGEIIVGRVTAMPTLASQYYPSSGLVDPTQWNQSDGQQTYQAMRKTMRAPGSSLGYFATVDVKGGSLSTIPSGGNPAGKIDMETLREILAKSFFMAICDAPSKGGAAPVGGLRFDQSFMQGNWQLSRFDQGGVGTLQMDQPPLWSWSGIKLVEST